MQILCYSMMDLTNVLAGCQPAIHQQSFLSKTVAVLSICLVAFLCGGMLWQCSTCLFKYFGNPTQTDVVYSEDLTLAPIAVTVCNKGTDLNYNFSELIAVDILQNGEKHWVTVWPAASAFENFVSNNRQNKLQLCKTIDVNGQASQLRIRHQYSDLWSCKRNQMEVYLHSRGLFQSSDFCVGMEKSLFASNRNFTLALTLDTIESLNTPDFNCTDFTMSQTLDSCLIGEAMQAANNSAGCIFNYLG